MWRAVRRADGAVLFQNKKRSEVERWIRWRNAGFYVGIDFSDRRA